MYRQPLSQLESFAKSFDNSDVQHQSSNSFSTIPGSQLLQNAFSYVYDNNDFYYPPHSSMYSSESIADHFSRVQLSSSSPAATATGYNTSNPADYRHKPLVPLENMFYTHFQNQFGPYHHQYLHQDSTTFDATRAKAAIASLDSKADIKQQILQSLQPDTAILNSTKSKVPNYASESLESTITEEKQQSFQALHQPAAANSSLTIQADENEASTFLPELRKKSENEEDPAKSNKLKEIQNIKDVSSRGNKRTFRIFPYVLLYKNSVANSFFIHLISSGLLDWIVTIYKQ